MLKMSELKVLAVLILIILLVSCRHEYLTYPFSDLRPFEDNPLPSPSDGNFLSKDIKTFWFNSDTQFPGSEEEAATVLEMGKNPGMGVRALHAREITGSGVKVAIIDYPLAQPFHSEYADRIVAYREFGFDEYEMDASSQGPIVTSVLVGNECGVAPDAEVYYAAVPEQIANSNQSTATPYADALRWILEENNKLAEKDRIRVVSVAEKITGYGSPFLNGQDEYEELVLEVEKAGILVIDARQNNYLSIYTGFVAVGFYDPEDPDNVSKFKCGSPENPAAAMDERLIFAPGAYRTMAEHLAPDSESWQYAGFVGKQASIPYIAGVLALGWQVDSDRKSVV